MRKPREPQRKNTNLLKAFDRVNRDFFSGHVCGGIGWKNFPLVTSTIQAQCVLDERFIKVNPILDDIRVPVWYLDFVIYHEMLHLHHGPQQYSPTGYSYPHSVRFQCMEVKHPDYARAVDFESSKFNNIVQSWKKFKEWKKAKV